MNWCEIQEQIFSLSGGMISQRFDKKLSLTIISDASRSDIDELIEKKLIKWDFNFKHLPYITPVSNSEHQVSLVAYYGDAECGYCCVGCVLGCVSEDQTAIEISLIEKRCDADSDLDSNFLSIAIDAFTTYALYLNKMHDFSISKFVLVGPVEGVKAYYQQKGFKLVCNYNNQQIEAMTLTLIWQC